MRLACKGGLGALIEVVFGLTAGAVPISRSGKHCGDSGRGKPSEVRSASAQLPSPDNKQAWKGLLKGGIAMWNKNEVKGKVKQVKGGIKEKIGEVTDNPKLEAEGEADQITGKLQEKVGKARRKAGEAVEQVGKAISNK
jgi:uncharacterized protein YjbJ (UPF0337 family)